MAKVIGRVEIKVSAKVDNSRPSMQREMEKDLDAIEKRLSGRDGIKIPVKVDDKQVKEDVDRAHDKASKEAKKKKDIELKVGFDYDSVLAGVNTIRRELERLDDETIRVDLNKDALEEKLGELQDRLTKDPIHMRVSKDVEGYKEIVRKLESIQREHGKVDLTFQSDEASLQRNIDHFNSKIEKMSRLNLSVDYSDINSVKAALKALDSEIAKKRMVDFEVKLDDDSLNKAYNDLRQFVEHDNWKIDTIDLDVNYDDLGSVEKAIKSLDAELAKMKEVSVEVEVSEDKIREAKARFEKFKNDLEDQDVDVPIALTGTALAAARLQWLTRPRTVSIIAKVDAKSVAVAIGLLRSLSGVNTLQKFGQNLERIITDFDQFAASITKVMGVLGNFSNVLGYMGTSLFSIGGGLAQMIGLMAAVPAMAAGMVSVWGVLRIGFNNFAESFSEIPEVAEAALEKLPPAARKARDALVGVFRDFQDPIQNLFWEGLGDSMETFAKVIVPRVQRGMLLITDEVSAMTKSMLDSFEEISRNGTLDTMFQNLEKGLRELQSGIKPFFDAINTLGFRGSHFFERMGRSLSDMSKDFNEFIQHAEKMGHIEGWINSGMEALKDTWGVVIALKDQFKALTQIINAAGGQGLDGFRENMEAWARVMEAEPFRSRMVRIFRGAREGASALNVGFKQLAETVGEMSHEVEALELQLGRIGGEALERIADIIGAPMLHAGLLNGLLEIERALEILQPAAKNIGTTLGAMFDIAGDSILGVAPMLNQLTDILRTIVLDLSPALKDTIPTLTDFLRNFIQVFGGGLQLATTVLGAMLDSINSLPGPLRNLALAFATFLALRGRIGGMMSTLSSFWNAQKTSFVNGVATVETNAQRLGRAYDGMVTKVDNGTRRIGAAFAKGGGFAAVAGLGGRYATEFDKAAGAAERGVSRIGKAAGAVRGAVSKFAAALGSIVSFGGGVGGMLLFTGIIAGISAIGSAARKEKEAVEEFRATLDEFGNTTSDSRRLNATWLSETTTAWEGEKATLLNILDEIGVGSENAIDALSGTTAEYEAFMGKLDGKIQSIVDEGTNFYNAHKEAGGALSLENQRVYDSYLAQGDVLNSLRRKLDEYQRVQDLAKQKQQDIAKALGTTTEEAATLDAAITTLGDAHSSGAQKASAMSKALDVLNGSMRDQDDATIAAADAVRNLRDAIKQATTGDNKISLADMIDTDGRIDLSFDADPTGAFAQVKAGMESTIRTGIEDGIINANAAPPPGKLTALKVKYEEALRNLRAEILPQLGKGGEKKLDAWLKANGYDWDTISAIVTGEISEAEWAAIPEEGRALLKQLIGTEPFVDVPIDGNYLPLEGKMTIVDGILKKLGATKTTPKIDADGKPLSDAAQSAVEKLRGISNEDAKAIIDGDIKPLTEKEQIALRKLMGIDKIEAIPTLDANGKPLDDEMVIATAMLLGFSKKEAIAFLKANKKDVDDKTMAAQKKVDGVKQKTPIKLDANGNPLKDQTGRAQNNIDGIKQKREPKIDADGKPAKNEADEVKKKMSGIPNVTRSASVTTYGVGGLATMLSYLRQLRSKTVYATVVNQQKGSRGPTSNHIAADGGIMGQASRFPLKKFANGGFSMKPTSAHIAKAGSYVMYAEQETGGEAFIPLAASKRARSTEIWKETGKRLGVMADGGLLAEPAASTQFNITNYYPQEEPNSTALNRAAQITTVRDRG